VNSARVYAGQDLTDRRRQRRERFLAAAIALFGTQGYAATSVPAVCREAGLSSRQFYEEFSSREDLLRELYDQVTEQAMAAVVAATTPAIEAGKDFDATVEAAVRAFVSVYFPDDRLTRISFVEVVGVSPALEEHRHRTRQRWAELLDGAVASVAANGLPVGATSPLQWAAYIGAVNAAIVARTHDATITEEDVVHTMLSLLRPGILPRAGE